MYDLYLKDWRQKRNFPIRAYHGTDGSFRNFTLNSTGDNRVHEGGLNV
jgi:hypothetical protein